MHVRMRKPMHVGQGRVSFRRGLYRPIAHVRSRFLTCDSSTPSWCSVQPKEHAQPQMALIAFTLRSVAVPVPCGHRHMSRHTLHVAQPRVQSPASCTRHSCTPAACTDVAHPPVEFSLMSCTSLYCTADVLERLYSVKDVASVRKNFSTYGESAHASGSWTWNTFF